MGPLDRTNLLNPLTTPLPSPPPTRNDNKTGGGPACQTTTQLLLS